MNDVSVLRSTEISSSDKYTVADGVIIREETSDFLIPEDKITVDVLQETSLSTNLKKKCQLSMKPDLKLPFYIYSCYDEYARKFLTVNVGKTMPDNVPLVPYYSVNEEDGENGPGLGGKGNLLKYYNPGFSQWPSTFKKVPADLHHLISGRHLADCNYMFQLSSVRMKQDAFEPLFGSICLYTAISKQAGELQMIRVSETFHFDATPAALKSRYKMFYENGKRAEGPSTQVGDANGSSENVNKFYIAMPHELKDTDIYVVVNLSKVLTADPDKVVEIYKKHTTSAPDVTNHEKSCNRLLNFRQPLGIGIVKINCMKVKDINISFLQQKQISNDKDIANFVKELYPLVEKKTNQSMYLPNNRYGFI